MTEGRTYLYSYLGRQWRLAGKSWMARNNDGTESKGWCATPREVLLCREIDRLQAIVDEVIDLVDDVLYDPSFHPVTATGKKICGDDLYLLDHPVQDHHVPSLRDWFVRESNKRREALAAEAARKKP